MRKIIYCMLICITAFRGFVGDVMAVEMVSHNTTPAFQVAQAPASSPTAMPCHGVSSGQVDDDMKAADESKDRCAACDVCHLSVVAVVSSVSVGHQPVASAPQQASQLWHSAMLSELIKPPIS
jgi:hypothetical protein